MPFKLVRRVPQGATPEDYGFKVYETSGPPDEEVAKFYLATKEEFGIKVPRFEALVHELAAAGRIAAEAAGVEAPASPAAHH